MPSFPRRRAVRHVSAIRSARSYAPVNYEATLKCRGARARGSVAFSLGWAGRRPFGLLLRPDPGQWPDGFADRDIGFCGAIRERNRITVRNVGNFGIACSKVADTQSKLARRVGKRDLPAGPGFGPSTGRPREWRRLFA
jgi:hypothetical protein